MKFDSTFLKWIWGLIKRTCVDNKWGYFYYYLYFYLQPIFAVIMQKKKKKSNPHPNQKTHTTHDPGSALQVAEFSRCGSKWNGPAPHWEDLAVSSVCGPSHHQTALFLLYTQTSLGYHRTADPRERVVLGLFKWFFHKWRVALLGRPSKLHKCTDV